MAWGRVLWRGGGYDVGEGVMAGVGCYGLG